MNPELTAGIIAVLVSALVQLVLAKRRNGQDKPKVSVDIEAMVLQLIKEQAKFEGSVTQKLEALSTEQKRVQEELGRFRDDLRRFGDIVAGCKYCRLGDES